LHSPLEGTLPNPKSFDFAIGGKRGREGVQLVSPDRRGKDGGAHRVRKKGAKGK